METILFFAKIKDQIISLYSILFSALTLCFRKLLEVKKSEKWLVFGYCFISIRYVSFLQNDKSYLNIIRL